LGVLVHLGDGADDLEIPLIIANVEDGREQADVLLGRRGLGDGVRLDLLAVAAGQREERHRSNEREPADGRTRHGRWPVGKAAARRFGRTLRREYGYRDKVAGVRQGGAAAGEAGSRTRGGLAIRADCSFSNLPKASKSKAFGIF